MRSQERIQIISVRMFCGVDADFKSSILQFSIKIGQSDYIFGGFCGIKLIRWVHSSRKLSQGGHVRSKSLS